MGKSSSLLLPKNSFLLTKKKIVNKMYSIKKFLVGVKTKILTKATFAFKTRQSFRLGCFLAKFQEAEK